MSSEQTYLLRLQAPGTKELKVSAVDVFGTPSKFESQLTSGFQRKFFGAYNNSDVGSGEIVWGSVDVTEGTGMPIPKGAIFDLPVSADLDVYFCNTVSGEIGNLRVIEIA